MLLTLVLYVHRDNPQTPLHRRTLPDTKQTNKQTNKQTDGQTESSESCVTTQKEGYAILSPTKGLCLVPDCVFCLLF